MTAYKVSFVGLVKDEREAVVNETLSPLSSQLFYNEQNVKSAGEDPMVEFRSPTPTPVLPPAATSQFSGKIAGETFQSSGNSSTLDCTRKASLPK